MKQKDIAKKVGLTEATISRYFNGTREPKLDDLEKMLDAVGLSLMVVNGEIMSKSILDNDKVCFICGTPFDLHKHHVFKGTSKRNQADEDGCWCWLCGKHHNLSNEGVHLNTPFNITLEKFTQHLWEEKYGTREQFRERYGKSYL